MLRTALPVLLTSLLIGLGSSAHGQLGRRYFDESEYGRLGLEQVWTTQVQLDSSRTQVNSIHLQVVGMDSYESLQQSVYEVYEVNYDGRTLRFSENDIDASGHVLGRAEAKRLAEKEVILLDARGFQAELTTRNVPPVVVYLQSNRGTLHAIDAETGKTLWAVTVGNPRYPMLTPAANDHYVAAVNGSTLYLMDRATGEPIWDRPLDTNASSSLAIGQHMVFVPGTNGKIEGYRLPDEEGDHRGSPPWVYFSGRRITPPTITSSTVSWGTVEGHMYVASLDGPRMLYRLDTSGPIDTPTVALPPTRLVIASRDGYVRAVNEQDGALLWSFSTGYELYETPVAHPDFTYAVTSGARLFCMSSEDGAEQWVAPGIEQVIACGAERIYARASNRQLVALDKKTGHRLATLATPAYRFSFANDLTDRIYLATNDGTLLCLREKTAAYPVIYRPLPEATQEADAATTPRADTEPVEEPDAPPRSGGGVFGDDIFNDDAGAGDKPADQPAAESDDAPANEEEFDDPFDFG